MKAFQMSSFLTYTLYYKNINYIYIIFDVEGLNINYLSKLAQKENPFATSVVLVKCTLICF